MVAAPPGHLVEGTNLPTAFIGTPRRDFKSGWKSLFRAGPHHLFEPAADKGKQEDSQAMIELTRLNGKPMVLNSDLIKTAEASPDTMLTLINGEKLIVREDLGEVVSRTLVYRGQLMAAIVSLLPDLGRVARAASITSLQIQGEGDQNSDDRPDNPDREF